MGQITTIIFVVALVLLWILIRGASSSHEKKRTEEFVQIAKNLKMSPSKKVDRAFRDRLKPFHRFRRGRNGTFRNILHENKNDVQMVFFECFYERPVKTSDSSGRSVMEGVFYFYSPSLDLPEFTLHEAEELQQAFLGAFGIKDINFENHPVFSKKYLLNSKDEGSVRALFSDKLIRFLENLNGVNIEGCGNQLIVYRPGIRIKTSMFAQHKDEAVEIFEQFRK